MRIFSHFVLERAWMLRNTLANRHCEGSEAIFPTSLQCAARLLRYARNDNKLL
jgi:hypothetical protein